MIKWSCGRKLISRRRAALDARCGVVLVKVVVEGVWRWRGSSSGTNRYGVSIHVGENGYQAWAIMSPYGSAAMQGTH